MLAMVCMISACKKSGTNLPTNSSSGTVAGSGQATGGTATTTGNTANYNGYLVKTVGISRIRIATDANDKLTVADFVGGGNHIVLKAGIGNKIDFSNKNEYEPSVEQYGDASPDANYYTLSDAIDNGKQLDTSNAITFKLKGFDKAKDGFNQLNLVLCKDISIPQSGVSNYNLAYLWLDKFNARSTYKNAFYSSLFTTEMKVSSYELAKPLSENPYIVRDIVSDGVQVVYSEGNPTTILNFFEDNGLGLLKLRATTTSDLNAGYNLTTGIVNADKQPLQYTAVYSQTFATTWYYPTFTNLVASSHTTIAEPADSVSKVFIRVSGFDVQKCGFNQLRIYLMQDPVFADSPPLQLVNQKALDKPNLDVIKDHLKTTGFKCIQLIPF